MKPHNHMTHICGQCQQQFETEEQYLDHQCDKTGFTPREPENLGSEFSDVSKAALDRGEARKKK